MRYVRLLFAALGPVAASGAADLAPPPDALFWPSRLSTSGRAFEGVLVDADRDGLLDLVYIKRPWPGDTTLVRCGTPDGFFSEPLLCGALPPGGYDLTVGDLNRDGMPDIVRRDGERRLEVFLGQGDGTFAGPAVVEFDRRFGTFVVDHMDGDDMLDLAVFFHDAGGSRVGVLPGLGDGSFGEAADHEVGTASGLAVARLDGDPMTDLATWTGDLVRITLRREGGDSWSVDEFLIDGGTDDVDFADVDGDDMPDIIVTQLGRITVARGLGGGRFGERQEIDCDYVIFSELLVEDINGDGHADLLGAVNPLSNPFDDITIVLGRGDGTFETPTRHSTGVYDDSGVGVGDTNGDGNTDLVIAGVDYLSIFQGNDDGGLLEAPVIATGDAPRAVAAEDLNRDGAVDLVVGAYRTLDRTWALNVFPGRGDGAFDPPTALVVPRASMLLVQDLNDDRMQDAIVGGDLEYPEGHFSILLGDGRGALVPHAVLPYTGRLRAISSDDFDRDGHVDLVAVGYDLVSGGVLLFRGSGEGTFDPPETYAPDAGPTAIVVGDFNRDGRPDVATTTGDAVIVLLGSSEGVFGPEARFPSGDPDLGHSVADLAAGDFDGDGILDLAAISLTSISILKGTGDGRFWQSALYAGIDMERAHIAAVDATADGILDLLATSDRDAAYVMVGAGDGTFVWNRFFYETGPHPSRPAIADIDGDAALDLVFCSHYSQGLKVLRGTRARASGGPPGTVTRVAVFAAPNPFREVADLFYDVPETGDVRLSVLDVSGRVVRTLVDRRRMPPGSYRAGWDGRGAGARRVAPGTYFLRLEANDTVDARKIMRLP
jgi:hypothetical protein